MDKKNVRKLVVVGLSVLLIALLAGCATQAANTGQPQQVSPFDFILSTVWFILLGVFVYFILVLQPKFAKEDTHKKFIDQLKKQDEVLTAGGIYGRVVAVRAEFITVEIAPNVRVKVKPEDVHAPPAPPKEVSPTDQSQSEQRS